MIKSCEREFFSLNKFKKQSDLPIILNWGLFDFVWFI